VPDETVWGNVWGNFLGECMGEMSENFPWVDLWVKGLEIFQVGIHRAFSGENVRECLGIFGGIS